MKKEQLSVIRFLLSEGVKRNIRRCVEGSGRGVQVMKLLIM
jgi:16S rRNA U516 pseudouridylate synthase RsuA-like enzyme